MKLEIVFILIASIMPPLTILAFGCLIRKQMHFQRFLVEEAEKNDSQRRLDKLIQETFKELPPAKPEPAKSLSERYVPYQWMN